MAIRVLEKTKCYQCETTIMAMEGEVHPLCSDCQEEHDYWFADQLRSFGN